MALLIRALLAAALCCLCTLPAAQDAPRKDTRDDNSRFIALSYHEVLSDHEPLTPTAVRASDLAAQFAWLADNDYHPVSVDQILTARRGDEPLPANAVLLSFDDGKKDVYSRVFPLLKLFRYPAVIALVGQWLDVPANAMVDYDGQQVARSAFVTWQDVREMQASGLVEVASHAYSLHHGILANPQGNTQPAATTRLYADGRYEDDRAYAARLGAGLKNVLGERLGKSPRIIVWPYGRSNLAAQEIAAGLGMPIGLSLEDGHNDARTPKAAWKRQLIENSPSLQAFAEMLRAAWAPDPARSVHIDPGQWTDLEAGLSATLDRLLTLSPNIALVKPTVVRDGREAVLFPTRRRPVAADVLNHIAWQTERRAGVPVFIDLPEDWLNEPELVGDLARHVNFAGLRIRAAPGSDAAQRLRQAAGQWRWPLRLIYARQEPPPAQPGQPLPNGDLLAVAAGESTMATLPKALADQVLFEFDSRLPAAEIARRMRELNAAGFRQFGLTGFPEIGMDAIAPVLSLRSQPQLR
ncbi:MAG: poly-beta-1,6-N-acetyl-D-glucosamine N-deacetylase PgaB [Candidatus Accumulibacter propinquus]|jgi:poly-beta-1,6-N-acetyl-D-glucosamine N-deacetylase PgaB|uniref:poly-beta-1,6-N-acetyl-D-glucosamine N-deacetylase PgaB n=1 Tax=Candidatus Accumulibacter propinquus TaxID=2954380 RepID=UPI002FC3083F